MLFIINHSFHWSLGLCNQTNMSRKPTVLFNLTTWPLGHLLFGLFCWRWVNSNYRAPHMNVRVCVCDGLTMAIIAAWHGLLFSIRTLHDMQFYVVNMIFADAHTQLRVASCSVFLCLCVCLRVHRFQAGTRLHTSRCMPMLSKTPTTTTTSTTTTPFRRCGWERDIQNEQNGSPFRARNPIEQVIRARRRRRLYLFGFAVP